MKLKYLNIIMISCAMTPSIFALSIKIPALDRVRKKVDQVLQEGSTGSFQDGIKTIAELGMQNQQDPLQAAEQIIGALHWSKQHDVVASLLNAKKESVMQAAHFLKDIIKIKCAESKMPLIAFAQEIADEERKLKEVLNLLFKAMSIRKPSDVDANNKIKILFDQHTTLSQNLQKLIGATNVLLMI